MFNDLTGLGYGIVIFAIIIGVGTVVLFNFGAAVGCPNPTYPNFNRSNSVCLNSTYDYGEAASGAGYTNVNYLNTQMGQSGLAGWTPAVIAISVGLLFLGAFMIGKGKGKGRY